MKTSFDYGYEYARAMQDKPGFDTPVDINTMLGGTVDIPTDDYLAMRQAGIEPDSREYWRGFNDFFKRGD